MYSKYYKLNAISSDDELSSDFEVLVNGYKEYEVREGTQLEAGKDSKTVMAQLKDWFDD